MLFVLFLSLWVLYIQCTKLFLQTTRRIIYWFFIALSKRKRSWYIFGVAELKIIEVWTRLAAAEAAMWRSRNRDFQKELFF